MKTRLFLGIVVPILLVFSLFSCSSTMELDRAKEQYSYGQYEKALKTIQEDKDIIYSDKDTVLYDLDIGILSHFNGEYAESNKRLAQAERLMEYYQSKSFGQSISSFIINDKTQDYSGEEYEDIYTNLFMALNYIHLGMTEDALVEIRRFDNKQKALSVKYAEELANVKTSQVEKKVSFNNSALARYISMILYRSEDRMDSANVDLKMILDAYKTQKTIYPFSVPSTVYDEFTIPENMGRLNFVSFLGMAPVREEEILYLGVEDGLPAFALALPYMIKQGTKIESVRVSIYDSYGNTFYSNLEKIESIENIAVDTFNQKRALIYAKSIARSVVKSALASAIASKEISGDLGYEGGLWSMLIRGEILATEQADLRTSHFFPAEAYVGGVNLAPGYYVVEVNYYDKKGLVLNTELFEDVLVKRNALNLVESLCVK